MRHVIALSIKFVLLATVFFAMIPLFLRVSSAELLWFSLWMTFVAYALGDLYILPRLGNISATIADFGLAFVGVWFGIGIFYNTGSTAVFNAAFFSALLVALGEILFHAYMERSVLRQQNEAKERVMRQELQTETAEEIDVRSSVDEKDNRKS
jgi:Protein of unknown function (DUF2512)